MISGSRKLRGVSVIRETISFLLGVLLNMISGSRKLRGGSVIRETIKFFFTGCALE